jgi:hypothetical protein
MGLLSIIRKVCRARARAIDSIEPFRSLKTVDFSLIFE